jgi:hypothetical protein
MPRPTTAPRGSLLTTSTLRLSLGFDADQGLRAGAYFDDVVIDGR